MGRPDQNREPPAFMEYAAAMMAKQAYRLMTLGERGLLYSMRLELWVNGKLPADPADLAKILGFDAMEIANCLDAVMPFLALEGEHLVCPELVDYRAYRDGIREAQSKGGKTGAAATNSQQKKLRKSKNGVEHGTLDNAAIPSSIPTASGQVLSPVKTIQTHASKEVVPAPDPWVKQYTETEHVECTPEAYRKASRGG